MFLSFKYDEFELNYLETGFDEYEDMAIFTRSKN